MILVVGTVTLAEGGMEKLLPAAKAMMDETRQEDGCIYYNFSQDLSDPAIMHISEAWRDGEALAAHGAAPHMKVWRDAVGAVGAVGRDLKMHQADEGTAI